MICTPSNLSVSSALESIVQARTSHILLLLLISALLLYVLMRALLPGIPKRSLAALDDAMVSATRADLPGDSPAYYVGDNSNDVLKIKSLDLKPNPPKV